MKTVVFFAGRSEADALLNHSGIKFNKVSGDCYIDSEGKIFIYITGIGVDAVNSFFKKHDLKIDNKNLYIKAGSCGIINRKFEIMTPLYPSSVSDAIETNRTIELQRDSKTGADNIKLISTTQPINNEILRDQFGNYDLVDMESYTIAGLIPSIRIILVGTDLADSNSKIDFMMNIKNASDKLRDAILQMIKKR